MLYIGNHTSSSKGYLAMGKQMLANGGNTFAFFTRNPRGGKAKEINPQDVQAFLQLEQENHFGKLVAHAPYVMNCCAAKENLREFARETMADDLKRLELTPGNYYNFHPGSHVGSGVQTGIDLISDALNQILFPNQSTIVLLETMAGKGSEIGRSFEELAAIYDGVACNDKLRVCFDTCHVNDAGYDIVDNFDGVMEEFHRILGREQIAVFHINDSKNSLGAAKDRHANIGEGTIGAEALRCIVHHPDFPGIPRILETPYRPDPENPDKTLPPYKEEIAFLLQEP